MTLKQMRNKLWWMAGTITGKDIKTGNVLPTLLWNTYLNNAQEEIAKLGVITDLNDTCNTIADQIDYGLPPYVHKLVRVEAYDTDNEYYIPLTGVSLEWLNKNIPTWRGDASATYPQRYVRMGQSWLMVYPAFDAIVAAGIRIYYLCLGNTLTDDSDVSQIPAQFHDYVVKLAFIKMFPNHKDKPEYEKELARGWEEMENFVTNIDEGRAMIANS